MASALPSSTRALTRSHSGLRLVPRFVEADVSFSTSLHERGYDRPASPVAQRLTRLHLMCQVPTLGFLAPRGGTEPVVDDRSHCLSPACRRFAGADGPTTYVLLRAGEITQGVDLARKRRISARNDKELAKGPARLATALGVDRALDGTDACTPDASPITVLTGTPAGPDQVLNGPRTGVAGDGGVHPWRFWIVGDPTVSPYRAHAPRRRST